MLCILLLVCVVDGGCHRAFDRLDYTEGDKIVCYAIFIACFISFVGFE